MIPSVRFSKFRMLVTVRHLGCLLAPPPFPKDRRLRLIDFPIEKFIIAGPRVDLGRANLTLETAKMLIWMLLPCRSVRQPAIGTGKIFGHPYVACHPAIMAMWRLLHRPACPNSCATINERLTACIETGVDRPRPR